MNMSIIKNNFVKLLSLVLAVFAPLSLSALDWGLTTAHTFSFEDGGASPSGIGYQGTIAPWLSALPGDNGDLYVSAAFTASLANGDWTFVPELFRTSFSLTFDAWEIHLGRIPYADPLGFILYGLFDGVSFAVDTSIGTLSAGVWYTGLLYKDTANITVTEEDWDLYNETFSYDKFADTYFSSKRLAFALGWEHPGIYELIRLKVSLLGQADLNGRNTQFHSQYLVGRAEAPVDDYSVLDVGGVLGFAEAPGANEEFQMSLAGELGFSWYLPGELQDRLRIAGTLSSGKVDGGVSAFVPVSTVPKGGILKAKVSGISALSLNYTARLHRTFSLSAASTYFILSDLGTYVGWPYGREGHFLGNEFYARLVWSPMSDLQLGLGGGLFVPKMGNADSSEKPRWKVEFNAVLAVY